MDIPAVLKKLAELVSPNKTDSKPLEEVFAEKCSLTEPNNESVRAIEGGASPFSDEPWWKFHNLLLNELFSLTALLSVADEKQSLLSVPQQQTIKTALELIVVLGIVNQLPNGIGITLNQRSSFGSKFKVTSTNDQKSHSMRITVLSLMRLRDDVTMKVFVVKHLGDLLAALFSLYFIPELATPSDFRSQAKTLIETLVGTEFQPNVIKELLLLLGNPNCPPKVRRALNGFLTDRLMQKIGVVATMKTILDVRDLSSPDHWKNVDSLAKLMVTPHIKDVAAYYSKVHPQIEQLLHANEPEYVQVAVSYVRKLYERDPASCRKWFLDQLTRPLLRPSTEEEVSQGIEVLHNCCGIPCSDNWALPTAAVTEARANIFQLHCKTSKGVYQMKSKVADIAVAFVSQGEPGEVYDSFLFGTGTVKFIFGNSGGVLTEMGSQETDWETASDLFLDILMTKGTAEMKSNYFQVALKAVTAGDFEKKLISTKILSELASDLQVQQNINNNPKPIIQFVCELLKSGEEDEQITCLGLMVIAAVLDDPKYKKSRDWAAFNELVEPLKAFQGTTSNVEVRLLAEELRSTILSHGVVPSRSAESSKFVPRNNVDEAMKEAVDPLLPVRAHGLMSLAKLISKKEKDTYAKRDVILCLFKENLKEDDSYVYLAAIEGLAALAVAYPDDVLTTLIEQYRHVKNAEVKLKVGETLIKVTRLLNEMAVVYKAELIGAFLLGSQDDDHLVRASSLSNLGELCRILSFRLHSYLVEVLQLLSGVLLTDKHPEPRRAAVMVITLLLQGLGENTFSTLQELVLDIYRALKFTLKTDHDDVTKLHAELALRELSSCTINFLTPAPSMEKRIYVMDPPP